MLDKYSLWKSMREFTIPAVKIYSLHISTSTVLPKISRFINKYFYKLGMGSALNRYDNSITFYLSRKDKQLYNEFSKKDIFCNFGSGAFYHNRWINLDLPAKTSYYKSLQGRKAKDFIPINLCESNLKLPFNDQTVSLIYFSHTLEHLDVASGINFLKESYRILKPNGTLRIAVPSIYIDFNNLRMIDQQGDIPKIKKLEVASQTSIHMLASSKNWKSTKILEAIKINEFDPHKTFQHFKQEGLDLEFDSLNPSRHISYWGYEQLLNISIELNFRFFLPSYRGSTSQPPFENIHVFDSTEPHISMYFELIK
jgi:predicted SAM-dependent methyltransferase